MSMNSIFKLGIFVSLRKQANRANKANTTFSPPNVHYCERIHGMYSDKYTCWYISTYWFKLWTKIIDFILASSYKIGFWLFRIFNLKLVGRLVVKLCFKKTTIAVFTIRFSQNNFFVTNLSLSVFKTILLTYQSCDYSFFGLIS